MRIQSIGQVAQVKDGRKKKGKRYPLAFILTLILLGKLAGETKLEGIIDWINLRKKDLRMLLNWPKAFPSNNTYTNALSQCDGEEVVKVIAHIILKVRALDQCAGNYSRWLEENAQSGENLIHTAMDGKAMKGTLQHANEDQPPVWLVALISVSKWHCACTENLQKPGIRNISGISDTTSSTCERKNNYNRLSAQL